MAYLSLYRKYRPSGFDGIIGQEQVVRILRNQINQNHVGHAYLFCGSRGTGKTSAAKIFAKAVNCLHPVNGSPCGECEVCKALSQSSNMDILEIDAASNNGVEEIRELIDRVQYPPVMGRYKVFIIDEVHMLSISAFNALLKTLEEPPAHALFILATTEVHKLPATILSRCMRFDFRLIPEDQLVGLISKIFDDIGLSYEKEAVRLIAKSGAGSCRDCLSVAEMCVSFAESKLSYRDVLEVIGSADREQIYAFADKILQGDCDGALVFTEKLLGQGKLVPVLNRDLISHLRDLCVVKLTRNGNDILHLPQSTFDLLKQSAAQTDAARLLYCIDVLARMEAELKYTVHPRVLFETAVFRCTSPSSDYDPQAFASRLAALESGGVAVRVAQNEPVAKAVKESVAPKRKETKAPAIEALQEESEIWTDGDLPEPPPQKRAAAQDVAVTETEKVAYTPVSGSAEKRWGSVIQALKESGNVPLYFVCRELLVRAEGTALVVQTLQQQHERLLNLPDNQKKLKELVLKNGFTEFRIGSAESVSSEQQTNPEDRYEELKSLTGDKIKIK